MQQDEPTNVVIVQAPAAPAALPTLEPKTDKEKDASYELRLSKKSRIWIKDSAGYPSITVTFLTVAFWITTLAYVLSMVESVGGLKFRAFDAAASTAYFIPLLTLYFGRKWTDAKLGINKE